MCFTECVNNASDAECEEMLMSDQCTTDYANAMMKCYKTCSNCELRGKLHGGTLNIALLKGLYGMVWFTMYFGFETRKKSLIAVSDGKHANFHAGSWCFYQLTWIY